MNEKPTVDWRIPDEEDDHPGIYRAIVFDACEQLNADGMPEEIFFNLLQMFLTEKETERLSDAYVKNLHRFEEKIKNKIKGDGHA